MTNDVRSTRARLRLTWVLLLMLVASLWAIPAAARMTAVGEGVVPAGSGGGVQSLSAGRDYVCALRWDRSTQCWGNNYNGEASPPYQLFVAVRSGESFSCGLDEGGQLTCWGANYAGQTLPPPGPFTSFDLGRDRGCAIRTNGELACWGTDPYGNPVAPMPGTFKAVAVGEYRICGLRTDNQIECSDQSEQAPMPSGEFVAISAGNLQACALRANGYVECWPSYDFPYGSIMPIGETFAEISVGEGYNCGLRTDGTVYCWGMKAGEVFPAPAGRFVAVVAGSRSACGVRPQGPVECWNENGYSTLFPPMDLTAGTLPIRAEGQAPEANGRVRALASGNEHSCALLANGGVTCWGTITTNIPPMDGGFDVLVSGNRHVCGLRRDNHQAMCWGEVDVAPPQEAFDALAAGDSFSCGLRGNGRASCWGGPYGYGRDIDGTYVAIEAGGLFACGLRADGQSECWEPWDPQPRRTQQMDQQLLQTVSTNMQGCGLDIAGRVQCWQRPGESAYQMWAHEPLVTLSVGEYSACGLTASGRVRCWNGYHPDVEGENFTALSLGRGHGCGLRADGTVRCWGDNYAGQATPPRELTIPHDIDAGDRHTCALAPSGEATCWGDNANGQGSVPNEPGAPAFVDVGSGDEFTCGLREDGRVQCWGLDANGQLQAPIDPLFRRISIGRQHGCGIGGDGQVRCWGWNSNGQATAPNDYYTRYRDVSAGFVHSCGVTETGEGRCWGYSGEGQTFVPYLENDRRWTSIQAGDQHSCGLRDDGMIQCWGSDRDGQVHNTPTGYFRALSAGAFHTCAIRTDGRLACWGGNWAGQSNAPEGTFVAVSAGSHHSCAVSTEGVKQCWGDNAHLQAPPRTLVPFEIGGVPLAQPYELRLWLIEANLDPSGPPTGGGQPIEAVSFRISDGVLPPGLSLSADGYLSGYANSTGTYHVTITAVDPNGFGASRRFELVVDGSPPEVYPYVYGSSGTVNGWYTSTFYLDWSISDPESGAWIVSGCDWRSLSWDTPGVTFYCTAQSAGGSTTRSITLRRDATAPETSFTSTPPAATNQTTAQFAFGGSDATSGVASYECSLDNAAFAPCTSPRTVTVAAGSHTFRVRAVDGAGHRDATPASFTWQVDATPPTVEAVVTGTLGANGWYVGDVQVSWTVADADSAITSSTGCNATSLTTDTPGAGFLCTVTSAGGTTSRSVLVKRDATAPLVVAAATTAANAAGWYRQDVDVAFSCSDANSGVVACPAAQALGGEGTVVSTVMTIADAAGNRATSNVVTVKIDRTAPTLAPVVLPGTLLLNANAYAEPSADDALSGIVSKECEALVTGSVGSKIVTCGAIDAAGNTATASTGYRVTYGFQGFNAPVQNPSVLNVSKVGRSVPFRWRVVDAQGAPVNDLTTAAFTHMAIGCPSAVENRITTYGGNYDQLQNLGNGYYQLDWLVPTSFRGSCRRLELDLGDGVIRPAQFKFN